MTSPILTYKVAKGDNLWKIAKTTLGSGSQWPRLWRYNNRKEVISATGKGIKDPDLIYIGQVLIIPRAPGSKLKSEGKEETPPQGLIDAREHPSSSDNIPTPKEGVLAGLLKTASGLVSLAYELDIEYERDLGFAIVKLKVTGNIAVVSDHKIPYTYVINKGEMQSKVESDIQHAFGKLTSETSAMYNPLTREVKLTSSLISQSKQRGVPLTKVAVELSPGSSIPKLIAEWNFQSMLGRIGGHSFAATEVKFAVEVTLRPPPPSQTIVLTPTANYERSAPGMSDEWTRVAGNALVTAGKLLIVATIIEDFVFPAGVLDDPESFALSGAMISRGLSMSRAIVPVAAARSISIAPALSLAP